MTWLVAILTLTGLAAPPERPAPTGAVPVDSVEALEHVQLPDLAGPVTVRVRSLESLIVLEAPRGAPALARAIRSSRRALCGQVEELSTEVRLHCRSRFIVAHLEREGGVSTLEIAQTRGLPWNGIDGPPMVAFDPSAADLGDPCPGSTAAGRAECDIAQGKTDQARAEIRSIVEGSQRSIADLREGDFALANGDPSAAARRWRAVSSQPWLRLAAVRLCELARNCLAAPGWEDLYATDGLPETVALDLTLRHARVFAFLGQSGNAIRMLEKASYAVDACASAPTFCQRIATSALVDPGNDGPEALVFWIQMPQRDRGPRAFETELAAASLADRLGAPAYGATILAMGAGHAPARALEEHLLRSAELYLVAGDNVRAGVVLEFARGRAGKKGLTGARWAAVDKAVSKSSVSGASVLSEGLEKSVAEALLAAAHATDAAKAFTQGGRP
jgi:hypothetical protein